MRDSPALSLGPLVPGALPLQQLAGNDAQALSLLVLAWVPAGALGATALSAGTRLRPAVRAATAAAFTYAVLFVAGAASDAVARNDPPFAHVSDQLHRAATVVATALVAVGALMVRRRLRAGA